MFNSTSHAGRTPIVLQSERADCGPACLSMVLQHHGAQLSLSDLRRRHAFPAHGMTLSQMMQVARNEGLITRAIRAEPDDLGVLVLPAILHWEFDHFVVLETMRRGRATIIDPSVGRRQLSPSELSEKFTGIALEVAPAAEFVRAQGSKAYGLFWLLKRLPSVTRGLFGTFIASIAFQFFTLLVPLYMQLIIDQVLITGDRGFLYVLAVTFGAVSVFLALFQLVRTYSTVEVTTQASHNMSEELFRSFLLLPASYYARRSMGDVLSRFSSIDHIQQRAISNLLDATIDGIFLLALAVILFQYSQLLAAISLSALLVFATIRAGTVRRLQRLTRETVVFAAAKNSSALETVRAITPIQRAERHAVAHSRWMNSTNEWLTRLYVGGRLEGALSAAGALLFGLALVLIGVFGATEVLEGSLSVGMLVAFVSYRAMFDGRAIAFVERVADLQMVSVHGQRVAETIREAEESVVGRAPEVSGTKGLLEAENITFTYDDFSIPLLNDISVRFAPNAVNALVGASGVGKSTFLRILAGIESPSSGRVIWPKPSVDASGCPASIVGCVLQADTLSAGTLRENISMFDPSPDDSRISWALELAALTKVISKLPMGVQSSIGDLGKTLSEGQQRRLLLARALYFRPPVMLLDETLSALEGGLALQIVRRLLDEGITLVIATHDVALLQTAEQILLLDAGRLVPTAMHDLFGGQTI